MSDGITASVRYMDAIRVSVAIDVWRSSGNELLETQTSCMNAALKSPNWCCMYTDAVNVGSATLGCLDVGHDLTAHHNKFLS